MKYVNVYRVETGSQGLHDNLPLRQGSGRCFVEHAELSSMCSRPTFSRPGVHGPIYRDVHMSLIRARRHDHAVATASAWPCMGSVKLFCAHCPLSLSTPAPGTPPFHDTVCETMVGITTVDKDL